MKTLRTASLGSNFTGSICARFHAIYRQKINLTTTATTKNGVEEKTISSIKKFLCFKDLFNNLILTLNK